MRVNAIMLIYARPFYTWLTLESLKRCNLVKNEELSLGAIIIEHPNFSAKAIRNMLGQYSFVRLPVQQQQDVIDNGSASSRLCFMLGNLCNATNPADWFVYIENDVICNPDWFDRVIDMYAEASKKYKVGVMTPVLGQLHRGTLPTKTYGETYRGKQYCEGQLWVVTPDVMQKMLDYPYETWAKDSVGFDHRITQALYNDGYMNIASNDSHCAHIGRVGSKGNIVGRLSKRYFPHADVAKLYEMALSSQDGWGDHKEFPEVK